MRKFIIDRNTWLRGEYSENSYLLRSSDNKMCCLGQISSQCGISNEELRDRKNPSDLIYFGIDVSTKIPFLISRDSERDSDLTSRAMPINDTPLISDKEREEKLKDLFSESQIELEFIN